MGNEFCDAFSIETEYRRLSVFQNTSPESLGDNGPVSYPVTPKNAYVQEKYLDQPQSQTVKLDFYEYIIQCKKNSVKHSITGNGPKKHISINGWSKVYNKSDKQLIFDGQLKNSKFNGFGRLYKDRKIIYEGQFKDNSFDGWGITSEYAGEFRDGLYDGYGVYQEFQNQDRSIVTFYYEGYFQGGVYSGSGVLMKGIKLPLSLIEKIQDKDGIFQFINDQIQHEMNIIKLEGKMQIYIGQFSNGFRHGFGRLFTQKTEFSGQFSHNLYHGLGTIYNRTSQGKRVIQAVFKMGKQHKE